MAVSGSQAADHSQVQLQSRNSKAENVGSCSKKAWYANVFMALSTLNCDQIVWEVSFLMICLWHCVLENNLADSSSKIWGLLGPSCGKRLKLFLQLGNLAHCLTFYLFSHTESQYEWCFRYDPCFTDNKLFYYLSLINTHLLFPVEESSFGQTEGRISTEKLFCLYIEVLLSKEEKNIEEIWVVSKLCLLCSH